MLSVLIRSMTLVRELIKQPRFQEEKYTDILSLNRTKHLNVPFNNLFRVV